MQLRTWILVFVISLAVGGCGGGGGGGGDLNDGGDDTGGDVPAGFPPMSIVEDFETNANEDTVDTTADWNDAAVEAGVLVSVPVSSRVATIFGYRFATGPSNSGVGQYVPDRDVLVGADLDQANPNLDPAAAAGRRSQWTFSGGEIGPAGTITGIEWGPEQNATFNASYPNVKLRMGYQASDSMSLGSTLADNFDGTPTLMYDGTYDVPAIQNVGNTPDEPTSPHVGGYPENFGCQTGGTWNQPLYDATGFHPWPTPTTGFDWDPAFSSGAVLVFDASVQAGDFTQSLRSWMAVTFPCSGVLIGGFPERRLRSTYEGAAANPPDNFQAGIINPIPMVTDTRFTLTSIVSRGVSLFREGAFGANNDFGAASVLPAGQQDNAGITIEYQGADQIAGDRRTILANTRSTSWTTNVNDCDGFRYIRFRITLRADASTMAPARVERLIIPVTESTP